MPTPPELPRAVRKLKDAAEQAGWHVTGRWGTDEKDRVHMILYLAKPGELEFFGAFVDGRFKSSYVKNMQRLSSTDMYEYLADPLVLWGDDEEPV